VQISMFLMMDQGVLFFTAMVRMGLQLAVMTSF
jgi:hypothetical protein